MNGPATCNRTTTGGPDGSLTKGNHPPLISVPYWIGHPFPLIRRGRRSTQGRHAPSQNRSAPRKIPACLPASVALARPPEKLNDSPVVPAGGRIAVRACAAIPGDGHVDPHPAWRVP